MDALGTIKPVVSTPLPVRSAPAAPNPSTASVPMPTIKGGGESLVGFDSQVAEARRLEALRNAAQSAPQPLGNQTFTMFKDVTGQYITRFRDINSGKVTYIPEPQLLRLSASKGADSLVNIKV